MPEQIIIDALQVHGDAGDMHVHICLTRTSRPCFGVPSASACNPAIIVGQSETCGMRELDGRTVSFDTDAILIAIHGAHINREENESYPEDVRVGYGELHARGRLISCKTFLMPLNAISSGL